jgi:hypothetical protein
MLFWNSSDASNSDLLAALQNLANSLGNINIDMPRFSNTVLKSISVSPLTLTKIVDRENSSRRTTLEIAPDSTASKVILLHGISEPSEEQILNSPWFLVPGQQGFDDLDGGYEIWAYAVGGTATIKIALEYQSQNTSSNNNSNSNSNSNNSMEIQTLIGTGNNWNNSPDWYNGYNEINNPATGYKLFQFSSFNPNQEYNLSINPGALSYNSGSAFPINIYLFNSNGIIKALFRRITSGTSMSVNAIRAILLPIVKNSNSWAARLPASGGEIILKPNYSQFIGLIDVRLVGETYAKTAIFNYSQGQDTGTFTLVGP